MISKVTFRFTDLAGVSRFVQRTVRKPANVQVIVGQTTSLWYDPTHPARDKSIVVELAQQNPVR